MPRIFLASSPASSGDFASLTPPPLPRPPAWICALTTLIFFPPAISSRAAATASSLEWTSLPRGTATPYPRRISFAWYSWIFMGGALLHPAPAGCKRAAAAGGTGAAGAPLLAFPRARVLLRHLRAAAAGWPPFSHPEVQAVARAAPGQRRAGGGRAGAVGPRRPRLAPARAHAGVRGRRVLGHAQRGRPEAPGVSLERGAGGALAGQRPGDPRRGPRGAARWRGRQPRGRHAPRVRRPRRRLLRLQRHRGGGAGAAARRRHRARAGGGSRRPPGRRHRRD